MADASPNSQPQSIEALTKKYQSLDRKKAAAEESLRNAQQQLDGLKQQARDDFGTDDPAELADMLEKMKAENEQKRAAYQASLEKIEAELVDVESKHEAAARDD